MNAPVRALGNRSTAVMARRAPTPDVLDFFPTPPWATRALIYDLLLPRGLASEWMTVWEPAAGEGHMAHVLAQTFARVRASDVHDYGEGFAIGSFVGQGLDVIADVGADWIITNPPFNLALQFAERSIAAAYHGVALLVRTAWAEGADRYELLFKDRPPTHIAQFSELVGILKHQVPQPMHGSFGVGPARPMATQNSSGYRLARSCGTQSRTILRVLHRASTVHRGGRCTGTSVVQRISEA